ncbi:MAG TPA: methyltransferase domain-containing protein [Vicinamibacterales bacterium]|jgi:SAM-dependent methyltransferase
MADPTLDFWQAKFEAGTTPWDRGQASPQLLRWLSQGTLAPCRIAVPGCGSGYEVALLASRRFEVTALDYAPAAIARTRAAVASVHASAHVIKADVLEWAPTSPFDAIYEQTCLCALFPDHWLRYAQQLHAWLRPGGRMFALLAQVVRPSAATGLVEGPPYHCDINAVCAVFGAPQWRWPEPPFERVPHPMGFAELAVVLTRT